MKSIFTLLLALAVSASIQAQWEPLNFPEGVQFPDIEVMYAVVSHDNSLYGSSDGKRIQKSTDLGVTWTPIPLFEFPAKVSGLVSTGDRLYAARTSSFAEGTIFYTENDGESWQLDTVGMPNHLFYPTSKADIKEMIYCDEHLIATFDNTDAYYIKKPGEVAWVKNDFLAGNDPHNYACMNASTLVVAADSRFYFNNDLDGEFSTPENTNLSSDFVGDVVASNGSRVFIAGSKFNADEQKLYYSDDMGGNWINIDLSTILSTNVFSLNQRIQSIFAQGDEVYLSIDQDATDTAPDVYYSQDGGLTYVKFSAGLPDDEFGTDYIKTFINHQNSVYALGNFKDIYRNGGVVNAQSITSKNQLKVYPNPTFGLLLIESTEVDERVSIYNAWGALVIRDAKDQVDLSAFAPGIYFAQTTTGQVAKIIKQ